MTIDEKLSALGDRFRGLYTGRLFEEDGHTTRVETHYSVTFLYQGEYCETPWKLSVHEAFDYAINLIQKENP